MAQSNKLKTVKSTWGRIVITSRIGASKLFLTSFIGAFANTSIASWATTVNNNYPDSNTNIYNNDPYNTSTAASKIVYKLNGSTGDKTGLGITLKVMTGDVVNIFAKSFYHLNAGQTPNNRNFITPLLTSFVSGFASTSAVAGAGKGATGAALNTPNTSVPLGNWLYHDSSTTGTSTIPRAYINWILFDEQFRPVSSGSSFDGVNSMADNVKSHSRSVNIAQGGYLYVYCSNESNIDVYFDNLQVVDTRGPLLETKDYYPFGLTMTGISATAAGKLKNKYGITGKEKQSQEFSDGSGLEEYDFGARFYDNQIGRWNSIDPHIANYYWLSPYSYCNNNPQKFLDPSGMDPETSTPENYKDLPDVTIVAPKKPKIEDNSLANKGLSWANAISLPSNVQAAKQESVYNHERDRGWTHDQMTTAWRKYNITESELERFERGYQATQDWKNMSLISVGAIGAPILAIGGIETGAVSYLVGGINMSWGSRIAIAGVDASYQFATNGTVNPLQVIGSQFGPLTYALSSNTTFNYSTGSVGINPDATLQSTLINTASNIAGTELLRVSDGIGVGPAAGVVSFIPGMVGDQINQANK